MKLTQKQEGFKNDLFTGVPQGQAYKNHYSTRNMLQTTIDRNAHELAKNSKIAASLEEMRQAAKTPLIADFQERQVILTEIARGDLLDYQEVGADGGYLSIGKESPNTKAISEITSRTEYGKDGAEAAVVTKVKLHNPVTAIDTMNKMDKLYSDTPTSYQDNRVINIIVSSEKAKSLTDRLLQGERTDNNQAEDQ